MVQATFRLQLELAVYSFSNEFTSRARGARSRALAVCSARRGVELAGYLCGPRGFAEQSWGGAATVSVWLSDEQSRLEFDVDEEAP